MSNSNEIRPLLMAQIGFKVESYNCEELVIVQLVGQSRLIIKPSLHHSPRGHLATICPTISTKKIIADRAQI